MVVDSIVCGITGSILRSIISGVLYDNYVPRAEVRGRLTMRESLLLGTRSLLFQILFTLL